MTSREQAEDIVAELLFFATGQADISPPVSWAQIADATKASYRPLASGVVTALLAARVPCPTCGGRQRIVDTAHNTLRACPGCTDGTGGPLILLSPPSGLLAEAVGLLRHAAWLHGLVGPDHPDWDNAEHEEQEERWLIDRVFPWLVVNGYARFGVARPENEEA